MPMSVFVKICGITNLADAQVAADAGADLLGFILYAKSPRYIEPDRVAAIVDSLRQASGTPHPRTVGVFVNTPIEQVQAILDHTGLDYAQLHGGEPPMDLARLAGRGFKALRPTSSAEALDQAQPFAAYPNPPTPQLMIDAYSPQAYGGTGERADWSAAATLAARYPRLLLAGGLDPDNVVDALAAVQPWGVDVSSGVEAAPGRKDHAKVRAFLKAVRTAGG